MGQILEKNGEKSFFNNMTKSEKREFYNGPYFFLGKENLFLFQTFINKFHIFRL